MKKYIDNLNELKVNGIFIKRSGTANGDQQSSNWHTGSKHRNET